MAYTMLAERADRNDDLLRHAMMSNGKEHTSSPFREQLDEWLTEVPEGV